MRPGPQRSCLPVIRIMPHTAGGGDDNGAGAGGGEPPATARFASRAAPQPASAEARTEAAAAGHSFVNGVLDGCALLTDDWFDAAGDADDSGGGGGKPPILSPYGNIPSFVTLCFEPAGGGSAGAATFSASGVPRVAAYEVASASVAVVDGAPGSSVQLQFTAPLCDPLVPRGAVALRIYCLDPADPSAPAGLGQPLEAGGVQAAAEWIGEHEKPLRPHPDVPCNRIRVTAQLAPPRGAEAAQPPPMLSVLAAVLEEEEEPAAAAAGPGGGKSSVANAQQQAPLRIRWNDLPDADSEDNPTAAAAALQQWVTLRAQQGQQQQRVAPASGRAAAERSGAAAAAVGSKGDEQEEQAAEKRKQDEVTGDAGVREKGDPAAGAPATNNDGHDGKKGVTKGRAGKKQRRAGED